jgi:hypothetical protein
VFRSEPALSERSEAIKAFVREVTTAYPVSSYLPPSFANSTTFQEICQSNSGTGTDSVNAWSTVARAEVKHGFPALFKLVTELQLQSIPEQLKPFLVGIQSKSKPPTSDAHEVCVFVQSWYNK